MFNVFRRLRELENRLAALEEPAPIAAIGFWAEGLANPPKEPETEAWVECQDREEKK